MTSCCCLQQVKWQQGQLEKVEKLQMRAHLYQEQLDRIKCAERELVIKIAAQEQKVVRLQALTADMAGGNSTGRFPWLMLGDKGHAQKLVVHKVSSLTALCNLHLCVQMILSAWRST
jgi:hypothetical protein